MRPDATPDRDALAHAPLMRQTEALEAIVSDNPVVRTLLDRLPALGLPGWYLGAGAIAQTVWNRLHGFDPTHGIGDYDVVYFDDADLSQAAEAAVEARVAELVDSSAIKFDVTNEARVHTWYERRFGLAVAPYRSSEQAIATWPTTAASIGVRYDDGGFAVCAPYGLADLFSLVVRPNTTLVNRAIYEAKADRWRALWPKLTVLPWPGSEPRP